MFYLVPEAIVLLILPLKSGAEVFMHRGDGILLTGWLEVAASGIPVKEGSAARVEWLSLHWGGRYSSS